MNLRIPRPCVPGKGLRYQLRFAWLDQPAKSISFPCDELGNVDINSLTEPTRMLYLGARAMRGHYYAYPTVQPAP